MNAPWTLRGADGRTVAEVVVDDGDFPWLHGSFTALPGFEDYAPLFAEELRLLRLDEKDGTSWGAAYTRITEALTLHDDEGVAMADFLMHIEDGRARWRYLETAEEDEGDEGE